MFSNARQGGLFYILSKGEKPTLKIGQVESFTAPVPKYPTYNPSVPFNQQQEMVMDIKVKCGEEIIDFQKLPANGEVFNYTNAIVSDRKDAIVTEVETMLQNSRQIVSSVDYHNSVIEGCDDILKQLNPQFAKEKEQEEKIGSLENQIKTMKGDLGEIKDLLYKLGSNNSNSSSKQTKN